MFFPRLNALCCISASSWGPSKESPSLLYKTFLRSLLTYASPGWFPFLDVTNFTKLECLHRAGSHAITSCLSSSPKPLLLSEASIPPLRVTLIHFTLLSYERALCLPTSFPISGLTRLGVKPRLCRSSWTAFASTHPLMLPSTSPRKALIACPPFPPGNLPSFTVESTLSFPCSHTNPPLSLAKVRLLRTLTLSPPHDLVLWTDGSVPFPFDQGGSSVLANCSLCSTEAILSFSAGPVFCTLFAGLGNTNKSAISLLFSCFLTLILSSPPCPLLHVSFFLKLCGRSDRNCLLSPPGYNRHSFLSGNDAADELARWEALLTPSAIPCSLSRLISHIHSSVFLDWRHTVSSKCLHHGSRTSARLTCARRRHARRTFSRWIPARINSARWTNARLGQLPD